MIFLTVRNKVLNTLDSILANSSTRILATIMLSIFLFSLFFLVYTYNAQISSLKASELKRLDGIARTAALGVNGEAHQTISLNYDEKDALTAHDLDVDYESLHLWLASVKVQNELDTDVYTLVRSEDKAHFEFIGTSGQTPYYRHEWTDFHEENNMKFEKGASFGPYEDEHGSWLSAFAPIKTKEGKVVAILQIDSGFDDFVWMVRKKIGFYLLILLGAFLIMMSFMMRSVHRILKKERLLHDRIIEQNLTIKKAQNDVVDSIRYAKNIQFATLPRRQEILSSFENSFVLFKPRDIVSGDFYWIYQREQMKYFAVADCTGHGVPGAFMSLIGNTTLTNIMADQGVVTPAQILDKLNREIIKIVGGRNKMSSDGMDISILSYDQEKEVIEYAGANRPMLHLTGGNISVVKGDKRGIGGISESNKPFTNHQVDVKKGDRLYMYSDGYSDQFGGEKGKKYYSKRLRELITNMQDMKMCEQKFLFNYEFHLWKQNREQVDDVLLAGLEIG